jgi:hypothetical protein
MRALPDASIDVKTSKRYYARMGRPKRATIYFDAEVHRALRMKSVVADSSISDLVNDAVKISLAEDAEDLAAFEERRHEPARDFEEFVKSMKRRGRL